MCVILVRGLAVNYGPSYIYIFRGLQFFSPS